MLYMKKNTIKLGDQVTVRIRDDLHVVGVVEEFLNHPQRFTTVRLNEPVTCKDYFIVAVTTKIENLTSCT